MASLAYCIAIYEEDEFSGYWTEDTDELTECESEAQWFEDLESAQETFGDIPRKFEAVICELRILPPEPEKKLVRQVSSELPAFLKSDAVVTPR